MAAIAKLMQNFVLRSNTRILMSISILSAILISLNFIDWETNRRRASWSGGIKHGFPILPHDCHLRGFSGLNSARIFYLGIYFPIINCVVIEITKKDANETEYIYFHSFLVLMSIRTQILRNVMFSKKCQFFSNF